MIIGAAAAKKIIGGVPSGPPIPEDDYNTFSFNGSNKVVEVDDSASLDITGDITISIWVRFTDPSINSGWIFSKRSGTTQVAWDFHTFSSHLRYVLNDTGASNADTDLGSTNPLVADQWYHIVGTLEGTSQKLYIDGVEDASGTHTGGIFSSSAKVNVGNYDGASLYFNGSLASPAVWNRALSSSEISDLYQAGKIPYWSTMPPSLTSGGVLSMELSSRDNTMTDSTGNGNNGTALGGATSDGATQTFKSFGF